ncbi:hypothetical protein GCM10028790_42940 [Micromonospora taraxaci]
MRRVNACTIARLSGKNWYTDPIATSARSASRVVVSPSYPTSSTSSAQASNMRCTRATLRPCTGTRRSGPVVAAGVDTLRHPPSTDEHISTSRVRDYRYNERIAIAVFTRYNVPDMKSVHIHE